ncbi:MAG: efflux RND transporter periplasmic adaptor subunit [Myxococcales bacterium]|nr:efflux RND transporter periplasmic adaptor subunit [Myxococcales bacterium]
MQAPNATGDPQVLAQLGVGKSRKVRRWLWRVLALLLVGAIVAGVLIWRARTKGATTESFVTAPVELGSLRETVTATGTLSPLDAVEVGAEVTGRVLKVHVDVNDQVKVGQVLVEIDQEQLNARVEESQAQLSAASSSARNARASVKEAELKAQRIRELNKRGLASAQELETAEATLERAKASVGSASAQVTVARAGLKSAKTSQGKAVIKSPIDGIVLARSVEPGQTVTSGFQTPVLFTLARDITQMQLKVDVDEADVGKVKDGQPATFVVDAHPKRQFRSKVVRLNNLPKAGTTVITYEGLLTVDNSERLLRPGMTATATIVTQQVKDALTVPNAALRFRPKSAAAGGTSRGAALPVPGLGGPTRGFGRGGGGRPRAAGSAEAGTAPRPNRDGVYVVRDGKPVRVAVEIGVSDGKRTEVKSAELSQGAEVITDIAETKK